MNMCIYTQVYFMYLHLQTLDQLHTKNMEVLVTLLFLSRCVKVSVLAAMDRQGMDCPW